MDLINKINNLDLPQFRKNQIFHGIFVEGKTSYDEFTNLPKDLRAKLTQECPILTLKVLKNLVSKDNDTIKWSFLTENKHPIEAVLMLHKNGRRTLCVSCQSGCPVNCSFCWTGAMGFKQNLSSFEIIQQVFFANNWLKSNNMPLVNRIVFMGMGEPMINLPAVKESIDILLSDKYFKLSQRALTVSTSGYVPMMKKFWSEYPKIGVAISLHAPNQKLREELMPVAKQFDLNSLMETCREIQKISKRRITYEYILIDGVTDTDQNAYELATLLKGQLAHVNLIPYNPIPGRDFQRPSRNQVNRFKTYLNELGISATARVTMGDDIKAACGQLNDGVN